MPTSGSTVALMLARQSWRPESPLLGRYLCYCALDCSCDSRRYIDYALKRIRLMRHHKVEPFLVFDGGPLPAKTCTEEDREKYVDYLGGLRGTAPNFVQETRRSQSQSSSIRSSRAT